ncbi:MAG: hypothetical protein ACM3Q2_18465 [Syntrophothermus sp.]
MSRGQISYNIIKIVLVLMLFPLLYSCSKSGPSFPVYEPGRRDYTWTVDTVYQRGNYNIYLMRMWGSDPANVYAVGGGPEYPIWHYDGSKWDYESYDGFCIGMAIWGKGRNNTWIGTQNGGLLRSTAPGKWVGWPDQKLSDYPELRYSNMWGVSEKEIYAYGFAENYTTKKFKMAINVWNGTNWYFIDTPDSSVVLTELRRFPNRGIYIMTGENYNDPPKVKYVVYSYDGLRFREIYAGRNYPNMNDMKGEIYIDIGQIIYKYKDGKLVVFRDFRNTIYHSRLWGRSEGDFFFAAMIGGDYSIGHYNGTDLKTVFYPKPNYGVFDASIFDNEVFFLGRDDISNQSVIVHGKIGGEKQSK